MTSWKFSEGGPFCIISAAREIASVTASSFGPVTLIRRGSPCGKFWSMVTRVFVLASSQRIVAPCRPMTRPTKWAGQRSAWCTSPLASFLSGVTLASMTSCFGSGSFSSTTLNMIFGLFCSPLSVFCCFFVSPLAAAPSSSRPRFCPAVLRTLPASSSSSSSSSRLPKPATSSTWGGPESGLLSFGGAAVTGSVVLIGELDVKCQDHGVGCE
mmetsp:Transcript_21116/g.51663  ORF Transcript_21116/g.51663 Transcript_21116/m.51663 type:complete len:212 (+) Transcript_21116:1263-1898(+)